MLLLGSLYGRLCSNALVPRSHTKSYFHFPRGKCGTKKAAALPSLRVVWVELSTGHGALAPWTLTVAPWVLVDAVPGGRIPGPGSLLVSGSDAPAHPFHRRAGVCPCGCCWSQGLIFVISVVSSVSLSSWYHPAVLRLVPWVSTRTRNTHQGY